MHILFLSYDGITDALGQSQILPYLKGLSKKGFIIHIISAEKKPDSFNKVNSDLLENNINWYPIKYSKYPPVLSTIWDIYKMFKQTKKVVKTYPVKIIHCRGYITSIIGLKYKRKYNIGFLFDMRGFYADERAEGGLWNKNNFLYLTIYNWFKKKEKQFLINADYVISLTSKGKEIICNNILNKQLSNIEIIPCCVDLQKFNYTEINYNITQNVKIELNIPIEAVVYTYLGSIGTWYLFDEMLIFFNAIYKQNNKSVFLFISNDSPNIINEAIIRNNCNKNAIVITSKSSDLVPKYLSVSDWGLFFIKPVFSKQASSPTKLAEFLAMGIPVITNKGVGDVDEFIESTNAGVLVNNFSSDELVKSVSKINNYNKQNKEFYYNLAFKYFNKDDAINKYADIYNRINKT